ncbi:DUF455 family protein [Kitasatospora sp. GAS204B]|uniref:DUF455 family protein n=1 Tax=unclassified Kitasatospora TaxID=2633591 RepID=UPI00247388F0|nr:DUF455 family protein [Kitasatospora sp. GAS204B]MDH6118589.1 uncharacterized ferritin-like protein (DUF455 family) [Kitasatospora sp. GAS204B]
MNSDAIPVTPAIDSLVIGELADFELRLYHGALLAGRLLAAFAPRLGDIPPRAALVSAVNSLIGQAELLHTRIGELRVPKEKLGRPSVVAVEQAAVLARADDPQRALAWGQALLQALAHLHAAARDSCTAETTYHDRRLHERCRVLAQDGLARFAELDLPAVDLGDYLSAPHQAGASVTPTGTVELPLVACPARAYPAWAPRVPAIGGQMPDPDPSKLDDETVVYLLRKGVQIEFIATDVPLRSMADFADLPLGFYTDMNRHAHDEMRHTHLLFSELTAMGVDYKQFPYRDPDLYAAMAGQPLDHRMIVLSRTGEDAAIEVFGNAVPKLRAAGYESVAIMFDHVLADELRHVTYANRWLGHLYGGDDLAVEEATERCLIRHNEIVDEIGLGDYAKREPDHMAFRGRGRPNLELRAMAGFSERDLQRLSAASGGGE